MLKLICSILLVNIVVLAESFELPSLKILGNKEHFEEAGSFHTVNEEMIEEKSTDDPHKILENVPGLYIQEEDAFGLRPNIGLRGAHPHRSKKVTLMEDGVLIAPAPYSAPAAYYFPIMSKIVDVQVYKGPSSIKYGPNSIGGALNFTTRSIDSNNKAEASISYGQHNTTKLHFWKNWLGEQNANLLEFNRIQSEGFKELSSEKNTGFNRNDFVWKYRYKIDTSKEHFVEFKYNFANEDSNETYLGISSDDFALNPYQRYVASDLDNMKWENHLMHLRYFKEWNENLFLNVSVYTHKFHRIWNKFNGFRNSSIEITDVLDNPVGSNLNYYNILKGDSDSSNTNEQIVLSKNDRSYLSSGIQSEINYSFSNSNEFTNTLDFGILLHQDSIERNHKFNYYNMSSSKLVSTGDPEQVDSDNTNKDSSTAIRLYSENRLQWLKWAFNYGIRYEKVNSQREDFVGSDDNKRDDEILIPGMAVSYKINSDQILFTGLYKGMTLAGPSSSTAIRPEESINLELGYRLKSPVYFEWIMFYSDYSNLLGSCSFSAGCDSSTLDEQYNGGNAKISGIESSIGAEYNYKSWNFPIQFSFTYTNAYFDNNFSSTNKEWGIGDIKSGDPLPYLPKLKWNLNLGFEKGNHKQNLYLKWHDQMYDQSLTSNRKEIDSYATIDWAYIYKYNSNSTIYLKIDNILDKQYLVSYRPYGLRPGKPRWLSMNWKYSF